jgi:hypothetical protein
MEQEASEAFSLQTETVPSTGGHEGGQTLPHLLKTTGMQVTAEYAVGPIRINGRPAGVGQGTANRVGIRSILVFTP